MHMDSWVAYDNGKGLAEVCQTSFDIDKTDPVTMYQTLCELGWHFPTRKNDELLSQRTGTTASRMGLLTTVSHSSRMCWT